MTDKSSKNTSSSRCIGQDGANNCASFIIKTSLNESYLIDNEVSEEVYESNGRYEENVKDNEEQEKRKSYRKK